MDGAGRALCVDRRPRGTTGRACHRRGTTDRGPCRASGRGRSRGRGAAGRGRGAGARAAGTALGVGFYLDRLPSVGSDLGRLTALALVLAGPAATIGAIMARAWWPRLVGVVVTGGLAAAVFIGRALIAG